MTGVCSQVLYEFSESTNTTSVSKSDDVNYPQPAAAFVNSLYFFSFNLEAILAMQCHAAWNYYDTLMFYTLAPLGVMGVLGVFLFRFQIAKRFVKLGQFLSRKTARTEAVLEEPLLSETEDDPDDGAEAVSGLRRRAAGQAAWW